MHIEQPGPLDVQRPWFVIGGSGWESNPPRPALRDPPPILKTGEATGPQPLPYEV